MASPLNLLVSSFVTFFFLFSVSHALTSPKGLHLPIRKDTQTLQYYTTVDMGSNPDYINTVIDLGGELLWFDCDRYNSTTYRPIRCGSRKCLDSRSFACMGCNAPARPGCSNDTCGADGYNPFQNMIYAAFLGEDTMSTLSTDGRFVLINYEKPFPFACSYSAAVEGLANITTGMVGLARTNLSLHTKLASTFKLPHKFALCLPSSSEEGLGDIFIGGGPYYMPPATQDFSKSVTLTPLIINPNNTAPSYVEGEASYEYFIGIKSIKVDNIVVSFRSSLLSFDNDGVGGTKLSTLAPYTVLHSSIYKALVKAFVKAALSRKIKRVPAVAPFGACFGSMAIGAVPTLDLVLQNENVKWTFNGPNSMVIVRKNVMCLAFVDGGKEPRTAIVLGGHQLENYVLEFDLISSRLGFSSSLLQHNTSCSHYRIF